MDETPRSGRRAAGIALFAAAVAVLVYGATQYRPAGDEAGPVAPQAEAVAQATGAAEEPGAEVVEAPVAEGATAAPAFDLARVSPDGSAIVAGTAAPGAEVTVYADDRPLATAAADAAGNFVAMFEVEPSAAPQALTLGASDAGRVATSGDVVMLLPRAPAAPEGEAAPPVPAGAEQAVAVVEVPEAAEPVAMPAEPEPVVAATAIVRDGAVEVAPTGVPADEVSLASISYGQGGDEVTLAGRASAGALLRAYVDDRLAEEVHAGDDGRWSMDLGAVSEGLYRLRIDEVGSDGRVASRVETPFQRDYPRAPKPRPGRGGEPGSGTITVQPGNNLWTLAREHYGSGVLYTQIFTANSDLITDPDLIYPGQIFDVPTAAPD